MNYDEFSILFCVEKTVSLIVLTLTLIEVACACPRTNHKFPALPLNGSDLITKIPAFYSFVPRWTAHGLPISGYLSVNINPS